MMTDNPVLDAERKALKDELATTKIVSMCPVCGKCGRPITGAGIVLKDSMDNDAVCLPCVLKELLKTDAYVSGVIEEAVLASGDFTYDMADEIAEGLGC